MALVSLLLSYSLSSSQIGVEYGSPVKWTYVGHGKELAHIGIDTFTFDTLKITSTRFLRINNTGDTLAELRFNSSIDNLSCSDEGYHFTGFWIKWFPNHDMEESGIYVCNHKAGEWFYYYENNKLRKYENYFRTLLQSYPGRFGFLSGLYKEYFENGNTKITGTYKIVEEYTRFPVFNPEIYKDDEECCAWEKISVKYGDWIEYNEKGKIISRKYYHDKVDNKKFRDLPDSIQNYEPNTD